MDLLRSDEFWDPHAIAGLLKSFFRDLPSSILTRDLHMRFLSVMGTFHIPHIWKSALVFLSPYVIVYSLRPGRSSGKDHRAFASYRDFAGRKLHPSPCSDRPPHLGCAECQRQQDDDAQRWDRVQSDTRNSCWCFQPYVGRVQSCVQCQR